MGTDTVVEPLTAVPVSAPAPTMFTVMLATPALKPAPACRLKLTSRVEPAFIAPR